MRLTSPQNARIKNVVKLNQRRHRDAQRLTVVEGVREVNRALQAGITPREAYICPSLIGDHEEATTAVAKLQQLAQTLATQLFEVTPELFARMAYRGSSGGLLLVISYLQDLLAHLRLSGLPFLAIVENVEKPGNLGAILRTADAAGVDGVIVSTTASGSGTDLHNPNVIRASLGTLFTVPVAAAPTTHVIAWLRQHEIQIVVATPDAKMLYTAVDMTRPIALVTGSEAHGLSDAWLAAAGRQVTIPMHGAADSLNLSTATALLLYEAVRQREKGQAR